MRRLAAGAATAVLAAGIMVVGIGQPAAACACGAPTPPEGIDVSVGEERAIVAWDGTTERIAMMLDLLADGADTGLIMPTPAPPTVSLGDRGLFDALLRQTAPVVVVEEDWWGSFGGDSAGAPGGAPQILSEVDLGPIQAVTLAADDADGLRAWLDENGYGIDPAVQALLGDYVDRGWYFAALKLTGDEPFEGTLDPVRFEFAADEMVYPLALSQAASVPQSVRLYLFGDDRIQPSFAGEAGSALGGFVTWAGEVTEPELTGLGAYLTVWEGYFGDPSREILGDLALTSTGAREDVTPTTVRTRYVDVAGIPLGWLLVVGGVVLGLVLLVAVVVLAVVLSVRSRRGSVDSRGDPGAGARRAGSAGG